MKMQKAKVTERLAQVGAFAVVRVETVERGLEIADGLVRGGVPAMEISYTNANAGDVIAAVKAKYGDKMCVGAGTVMEAATARLAIMSWPTWSPRRSPACATSTRSPTRRAAPR